MKYHENRTPINKEYYKRYKQFKVMTENSDFNKWVNNNGQDIVIQNKIVLRELNFDYDDQKPEQIGRILNNMINDLFSDLEELTFKGIIGETESETGVNIIGISDKLRMRILVQLYMYWLLPFNRTRPERFLPNAYHHEKIMKKLSRS
tara:strand:- start:129 stop:572 length:444 start_codon:yes stop_codon:yes gene_type:complete